MASLGESRVPPIVAGNTTRFPSRVNRTRSVPACAESSSDRSNWTAPSSVDDAKASVTEPSISASRDRMAKVWACTTWSPRENVASIRSNSSLAASTSEAGRPKNSTTVRRRSRPRTSPSAMTAWPVPRAAAKALSRSDPPASNVTSPLNVPLTVSGDPPKAASCPTSRPSMRDSELTRNRSSISTSSIPS